MANHIVHMKRVCVIFLAGVYFLVNVPFLHSTETNFWTERRAAARGGGSSPLLAMATTARPEPAWMVPEISHGLPTSLSQSLADKPAQISRSLSGAEPGRSIDWLKGVLPYGDIGDHYVSPVPNAPLVVHIQDAHGIKDAQQNISAMLGALQTGRGVNLVGVEGASGAFNLEPFRAYPSDVVKDVADFFLDRGLIVGSEYAGLCQPKPLSLFGLEKGSLYAENVDALRKSYASRDEVRTTLQKLEQAAQTQKEKIYNPNLSEYDKRASAYKDQRESLSDYVKYLNLSYKTHGKNLPNLGPNVALLLDALDLEGRLDFKQVESDRIRLVETLVKRLSAEMLKDLVDRSVAYRAGSLGYGDYYSHLKTVCAQNKVDLNQYGQLPAYIHYVLAAEKIDKSALINELDQLETSVQDALTLTEDERRLVTDGRLLVLMDKLIHHEMTPWTGRVIYPYDKTWLAWRPDWEHPPPSPISRSSRLFAKRPLPVTTLCSPDSKKK